MILEAIGIGLAHNDIELLCYLQSTLFWQQRPTQTMVGKRDKRRSDLESKELTEVDWILDQGRCALDFLVYNEIVRQVEHKKSETEIAYTFESTQLGNAILKSGLAPEEGLLVYLDLQKA